jgi:N utilization substance protein A
MSTPEESAEATFVRVLGVPQMVARALCSSEITSLEELAYVPVAELLAVKGIQEWLLLELRERARIHLQNY